MKASKEVKRMIAVGRSAYGKPNGVIGSWFFDQAAFLWRRGKEMKRHEQRSKGALMREGYKNGE